MRKLSAFFILSLIIIQAFYNLGVMAYWLTNRAFIAQVLCENRDKPAMHCDGKCYFMKKMAAAAAQDSAPISQSLPKSLKKSTEIAEFLLESDWFELHPIRFQNNLIPTVPGCCSIEPAVRIFHPPAGRIA
jgi:hypothetical protein